MATTIFKIFDKGVDRFGYWIGGYTILSGLLSWLGKQLKFLELYGWPEAIVLGLGFACILMLVLAVTFSVTLSAWRFFRPLKETTSQPSQQDLARALSERPKSSPDRKKPAPVFKNPEQQAAEPYLSWWHVPISVEGDGGSPNDEIRHCTVEMYRPTSSTGVPPVSLRWQKDSDPKGIDEIVLVEGVNRLVPIVVRCEKREESARYLSPLRDGIARITGTAYIRDGNIDKFKLPAGKTRFKMRVKSGKKVWESPHCYILTVPDEEHGNGHFNLSVESPSP